MSKNGYPSITHRNMRSDVFGWLTVNNRRIFGEKHFLNRENALDFSKEK